MVESMIKELLDKKNVFAVVGVSRDTAKFGRKVFDDLKKSNYEVYPINPKIEGIGEDKCYPDLSSLPVKPDVVVFVVPPKIAQGIIVKCKELNIDKIWLQPGSESEEVTRFCEKNGMKCLYNQCVILNLKK